MRLRKTPFIWLAIIIVMGGGIRAYQARIDALDTEIRERYALATAYLSVFNALHKPDSLEAPALISARDSILAFSGIDSVGLNAYVNSFEDRERGISLFWKAVRRRTDSLIELELALRDTIQLDSAVHDSAER